MIGIELDKKLNLWEWIIVALVVIGLLWLATRLVGHEASLPSSLISTISNDVYIEDEIIVHFSNKEEPEIIKVTPGAVDAEIARYNSMNDVIYVEPNYLAQIDSLPNDQYYNRQWNFHSDNSGGINLEAAWDLSDSATATDKLQGKEIIVAIVDTGIAYENYTERYLVYNGTIEKKYVRAPDLGNTCFVPGYDFVNDDNHPNDDHGHGTALAGVVAQSTNNQTGVAGIASRACLMPIKVMNGVGNGSHFRIANGIKWAVDHGADVILTGFSSGMPSTTLFNAVFEAWSKGVLVVAPMGNKPLSSLRYPANFDDFVIGVTATLSNKKVAGYASTGNGVDLAAPGGSIVPAKSGIWQNSFAQNYQDNSSADSRDQNANQTYSNFGYGPFEGTSFAAAHVAGVTALLLSVGGQNISRTLPDPFTVETVLSATASDLGIVGRDNQYGWGLLNAEAAIELMFDQINSPTPQIFDDAYRTGNTEGGMIPVTSHKEMFCSLVEPWSRVYISPYDLPHILPEGNNLNPSKPEFISQEIQNFWLNYCSWGRDLDCGIPTTQCYHNIAQGLKTIEERQEIGKIVDTIINTLRNQLRQK